MALSSSNVLWFTCLELFVIFITFFFSSLRQDVSDPSQRHRYSFSGRLQGIFPLIPVKFIIFSMPMLWKQLGEHLKKSKSYSMRMLTLKEKDGKRLLVSNF